MAEKIVEKPKENRSENAQQQSPPNEAYFPITNQPQSETRPEMQEIIKVDEKHGEVEGKFQEFLKAINEETSQLAQFLVEERKLTRELCSLLTQILKNLRISFSIPSEYLARLGEEAKQVKLSKDGRLMITRNDDKVDSKPLEEHSADIILEVLLVIIPELERMIKAYRRTVSRRVSLLQKIRYELKGLQEAFAALGKEGPK